MVRLQSIDLKYSVATTQNGIYMGLSSQDKTIIRSLRHINEAFKIGNTHLILIYDGKNLELRSDLNKHEYKDMIEEYKQVKIVAIDKKNEREEVKAKTAKEMIKDIDIMNKKAKQKKERAKKKLERAGAETNIEPIAEEIKIKTPTKKPRKKRTTKKLEITKRIVKEKPVVKKKSKKRVAKKQDVTKELPIEKPKRKRRTKAEMESANLKSKPKPTSKPTPEPTKEIASKPKRKRRTKAEMELARQQDKNKK